MHASRWTKGHMECTAGICFLNNWIVMIAVIGTSVKPETQADNAICSSGTKLKNCPIWTALHVCIILLQPLL